MGRYYTESDYKVQLKRRSSLSSPSVELITNEVKKFCSREKVKKTITKKSLWLLLGRTGGLLFHRSCTAAFWRSKPARSAWASKILRLSELAFVNKVRIPKEKDNIHLRVWCFLFAFHNLLPEFLLGVNRSRGVLS